MLGRSISFHVTTTDDDEGTRGPQATEKRKEREDSMDAKKIVECGICYFQGVASDFAPVTVSADFRALECPKCLNNDKDSFEEITKSEEKAA